MIVQVKKFIATGFILGAFGVLFGAFGAHLLEDRISAHYIDVFDTANKYHFIHSLGMIVAVYILSGTATHQVLRNIFLLFLSGILLFSGSLYIVSLADLFGLPQLKILGAITPVGGVLFMAAWIYSAYQLFNRD